MMPTEVLYCRTYGAPGPDWLLRLFSCEQRTSQPRAPILEAMTGVLIVIIVIVFIRVSVLTMVIVAAASSAPAGDRQGEPPADRAQGTRRSTCRYRSGRSRRRSPARRPSSRARTVVFRVEVFAKKPTVEDILGPDYLKGPVPYGGMTHSEFLNMVTPNEYKGYSVFTNREGMTVAATSLAMQWALMKAIDKLKDAQTERAREAARGKSSKP